MLNKADSEKKALGAQELPWMRVAAAEIEVGKDRCPICAWPLAATMEQGCVIGNCSYRPGDHREDELRNLKKRRERWEATTRIIAEAYAASLADSPSPTAPPIEPQPEMTEAEMQHIREIAAKLPKVEHPQTFPDAAWDLFDGLLVLKYNEGGAWRVQVELADGTKAIIPVNNRQDGELARVQIRGIALQLLGHYLKVADSPSGTAAETKENEDAK